MPPANQISHDSSEFLSRPGTIIQVKVDTKIRNLDSVEAIESGSFIYSFFVPRDTEGVRDKPGYCSVVPQTYEEMMLYIEGRRRAFDTAEYAKALHEAKKA